MHSYVCDARNDEFKPFHYIKIDPKLRRSTERDRNLIRSEGGQDTSTCLVAVCSFHIISRHLNIYITIKLLAKPPWLHQLSFETFKWNYVIYPRSKIQQQHSDAKLETQLYCVQYLFHICPKHARFLLKCPLRLYSTPHGWGVWVGDVWWSSWRW